MKIERLMGFVIATFVIQKIDCRDDDYMFLSIKIFSRFLNYRTRNKIMSVGNVYVASCNRYCLTDNSFNVNSYTFLIF